MFFEAARAWRSKGEHSRWRYAARDLGREIPVPRMSQLPTNPILDRSGTPVLTGVYQQDSPSMLLQAAGFFLFRQFSQERLTM